MKCEDIQERLAEQIDQVLSPEETRRLTDHLMTCPECEAKYRLLRQTHRSLRAFGAAVRTGLIDADAPIVPDQTRTGWLMYLRALFMRPVPLWLPATVSIALLLIATFTVFSPLDLSLQWGPEKGGNTGDIGTPPLAAEAMLEFLLVPDPTDAGQLAASTATVEAFLSAHPGDIAMYVKLVQLYRAQIAHPDVPTSARDSLTRKLAATQQRMAQLLEATPLFNGDQDGSQ